MVVCVVYAAPQQIQNGAEPRGSYVPQPDSDRHAGATAGRRAARAQPWGAAAATHAAHLRAHRIPSGPEDRAGGAGGDGRAFHSSFCEGIPPIGGNAASQLPSEPSAGSSGAHAPRDRASTVGNRGRDRILRPEPSGAALPPADGDVTPAGALEGPLGSITRRAVP